MRIAYNVPHIWPDWQSLPASPCSSHCAAAPLAQSSAASCWPRQHRSGGQSPQAWFSPQYTKMPVVMITYASRTQASCEDENTPRVWSTSTNMS